MNLFSISHKWYFLNSSAPVRDEDITPDHCFSFKAHNLSIPVFHGSCLLNSSPRRPHGHPCGSWPWHHLPICHKRPLSDSPAPSLTLPHKAAKVTFLVWKSDPSPHSSKFCRGLIAFRQNQECFAYKVFHDQDPVPLPPPSVLYLSSPTEHCTYGEYWAIFSFPKHWWSARCLTCVLFLAWLALHIYLPLFKTQLGTESSCEEPFPPEITGFQCTYALFAFIITGRILSLCLCLSYRLQPCWTWHFVFSISVFVSCAGV